MTTTKYVNYARNGAETHVVPAYSPWVNGLVEGANKLLLHILKRLCAPDLNDEESEHMKTEDIPKTWPEHFEDAIHTLNGRLLPSLKFSPKELLLGLVVNIRKLTKFFPSFSTFSLMDERKDRKVSELIGPT